MLSKSVDFGTANIKNLLESEREINKMVGSVKNNNFALLERGSVDDNKIEVRRS